MTRIELSDVVERLVEKHYGYVDWRTVDSIGDHPIDRDLMRASIIKREAFVSYMMADGFIGCLPTVKGKWIALIGSGVITNYSKKTDTAVIDLPSAKNLVPKWKRVPFSASVTAEKEKEKNKKKVLDNVIYVEGSE